MPGLISGQSFDGAAPPRTWPTHYGRVPSMAAESSVATNRGPGTVWDDAISGTQDDTTTNVGESTSHIDAAAVEVDVAHSQGV